MKSRFLLLVIGIFSTLGVHALTENEMLQSVVKIKIYSQDSISQNYIFRGWGSGVMLDAKKVITNAHVILDENDSPTNLYEICISKPGISEPQCVTTAKLTSYDSVADLATLELTKPITNAKKMTFQQKVPTIGNKIIVYGYPGIGGSSITRTEGKIGGTEGESYKFDGTIDRGNSGGGAFDTKGNLIGIPYAVSSDNGVIGYIIPYAIVKKFLSGKTDNFEKYTNAIAENFKTYINNLQGLGKNINLIKTKYIKIPDLGKAGFTLTAAVESKDGKIFDYRFVHKSERVALLTSCSKDATGNQRPTWELTQEYITWSNSSQNEFSINEMTQTTLGIRKLYYTFHEEENGQTPVIFVTYLEKQANCATIIIADDVKKDKLIYTKALAIADKIEYTNMEAQTTSYKGDLFTNESIPTNLYVSEGTDISDMTILPRIGTYFGTNFHTSATIRVKTMKNLNGYMNLYYEKTNYYKEKNFSFDAFLGRFLTTGDTNVREEVLTSKNNQKFILSFADVTEDGHAHTIMTYPFKTTTGELKLYEFHFAYPTRNTEFENAIRSFFQNTELPGSSPFTN